jgi:acyl-CoA dehydrogenase
VIREFPWPVLEEAAARGFYDPLFYRDLIGDPTGMSLPMFMEELFWGCAGIGLAIVMPALALSAIGQAASPEQMLQWAPECFGTPDDLKLAALAISEPEGGSDVRNLRTRARRDGDDWIIGDQALFIVPGGTQGLELVRKLDKLGCRASHTAELKFNGVRGYRATTCSADRTGSSTSWPRPVRRSRGAKHSGCATMGTFEPTRPMVAAQALGIARAALEYATEYANRREAFGAPIIDNQGIAFPLADLATAIDAARLLTWRASWMAPSGVPFERGEGSMAKLAASEVAVRTTERAIQTMGGWGYIKDHPVEKCTETPSCTPSLRARARFSGSSSPTRSAPPTASHHCTSTWNQRAGPLNLWFGRGTPLRARVSDAALSAKDHIPGPIIRLAMNVLRPPRK